MGDAGVEIVEETLHERGELALVGADEIVAQERRQRRRGRLVTGAGADRDLRPLTVRRLAPEIAEAMHEAALAHGPWAHVSTARIRPGAPSVMAKRGTGSPRRLRSSKKAVQLAVSSLVPGARWSSTFCPASVIPQAQSTASRGSPACRRRRRHR